MFFLWKPPGGCLSSGEDPPLAGTRGACGEIICLVCFCAHRHLAIEKNVRPSRGLSQQMSSSMFSCHCRGGPVKLLHIFVPKARCASTRCMLCRWNLAVMAFLWPLA